MGAVIEVFARWATPDEQERAAIALKRFCLSPRTPDWLGALETRYPKARQAWKVAERSLAQLMECTHEFALSVGSVSMAQGSTHEETVPHYVSTFSIGYIDGFSIRWNNPVLVTAASDLAKLLEALGAIWSQTLTLD